MFRKGTGSASDHGNEARMIVGTGERDRQSSKATEKITQAVDGFEYCDLDPVVANSLRKQVDNIRHRIGRQTADIIAIGNDLLESKKVLAHGMFTTWVEREIRITIRAAQLYMRAAEWSVGKGESVSLLPPTTIYLLASKGTPAEIGAEVIEKIKDGAIPDPIEIEQRVKEARYYVRGSRPLKGRKRKKKQDKAARKKEIAAEREEDAQREAARELDQNNVRNAVAYLKGHVAEFAWREFQEKIKTLSHKEGMSYLVATEILIAIQDASPESHGGDTP